VSHRLGEVVQVDGGEAEEVVAAEPTDCRHASFSPLSLSLSLYSGRRRAGSAASAAGWGRRSIRIRDSSRRNAAGRSSSYFLEASGGEG
jgi:hypothetical protein